MYEKWTTEVPQYRNNENGMICGGSAPCPSSSNLASYRLGINSATVNTDYNVGFRLVLIVEEYNLVKFKNIY